MIFGISSTAEEGAVSLLLECAFNFNKPADNLKVPLKEKCFRHVRVISSGFCGQFTRRLEAHFVRLLSAQACI